jgi:hypothetical protein
VGGGGGGGEWWAAVLASRVDKVGESEGDMDRDRSEGDEVGNRSKSLERSYGASK